MRSHAVKVPIVGIASETTSQPWNYFRVKLVVVDCDSLPSSLCSFNNLASFAKWGWMPASGFFIPSFLPPAGSHQKGRA